MKVVTFEEYFEHIGHNYKAQRRVRTNVVCPFCKTEGGKVYPVSDRNNYPKFICFNEKCPEAGDSLTVVQMHARLQRMPDAEAFLSFAKMFGLASAPRAQVPIVPDAPSPSPLVKARKRLMRQMKVMELAHIYLHLPRNNRYRTTGEAFGGTLKEELVSRFQVDGISKTTFEKALALKFAEMSPAVWDKTCRAVESVLGVRLVELNALLRAGYVATNYPKYQESRLRAYAQYLEEDGQV